MNERANERTKRNYADARVKSTRPIKKLVYKNARIVPLRLRELNKLNLFFI